MSLDQYKLKNDDVYLHGNDTFTIVPARLKVLQRKSKRDLQEIVKRYNKVVDVRGVSKDVLISEILEDEFGKGYSKYL